MDTTALAWFRRDLRLEDNAALVNAVKHADAVVPVWVAPSAQGAGEAAWTARSLATLDTRLRERGSALVVRSGAVAESLGALADECGARTVCCARVWTPQGLAEEQQVASALTARGVRLIVSGGSLLVNPDALATGAGDPYRVFTPYFRAWERVRGAVEPLLAPHRVSAHKPAVPSEPLPDVPSGSPDPTRWWKPGEAGAHRRLAEFVDEALEHYDERRDIPALDATSRLSPHLAFGEISPHQVVAALEASGLPDSATRPFVRQLAWREFAAHVLFHHPRTLTEPLRSEFAAMPWREDPGALETWRAGRTGYPLVDAGMRQLATTGWMHNRVRLVAASFLTKHLLVPWHSGERAFSDALVDFDVASNVFNWQWVAGCGADAAPYFRIFSPTAQVKRFDREGAYIRRWVPELGRVPDRWIAEPWRMPDAEARSAGVRIGTDYPEPLIDHREARIRALAAYAAIKSL